MKSSLRASLCCLLVAGCLGGPEDASIGEYEGELNLDTRPQGKGGGLWAQVEGHAGHGRGGVASVSYHGGPIMLGTPNVYYIWYGAWNGNTAVPILEDLARNIGGSPYYNINTTYTDGAGNAVSNAIAYGSSTTDDYSQGRRLDDASILAIVRGALDGGRLPLDANGVYFVLTSADVRVNGFCNSFCGWHTHATISQTDIKYSFVGSADRCLSSCAEQTVSSPNGNPGADGMASIVAHELEEATTDPDLNAWYDRNGLENADKCAWTFGTTYAAPNGSLANMRLGARDYLIQRNWLNVGAGSCAQSF